jgi:type II secretory ATPase GspE/PulE/Tfp pilus assembly ATPase PilB-like protein
MALYRKRGCPRCSHSGYCGIGVYELLEMTIELAASKASREEVERAAVTSGICDARPELDRRRPET